MLFKKILGDKGLERTTSNSMHKEMFLKHTYRNGHVRKVAHTHPQTHMPTHAHTVFIYEQVSV